MRALSYALAWDEEHLRDGRDGSLNLQTSRHAASTKWTSICTGTLREIAKAAILILLLAIGLHRLFYSPELSRAHGRAVQRSLQSVRVHLCRVVGTRSLAQ